MPYVLKDLSKYVLIAYSSNRESITKKNHVRKKFGIIFMLFLTLIIVLTNEKEPPHNYQVT